MTDLSNLPPEVREALTRSVNYSRIAFNGERFTSNDADTLRDYILRVTAENAELRLCADVAMSAAENASKERDALAKRIADAPVGRVFDHGHIGDECAMVDAPECLVGSIVALVKVG